jgi:serine/threonine-protein kinase Chk1
MQRLSLPATSPLTHNRVRKAVVKGTSAPVYAVKFIHKEHAYTVGRLKPRALKQEIALHHHLTHKHGHKNIISIYGDGEDANYVWICMELAEGGDLFDKIEADVGVGEDIAHLYLTQLVGAVSYMHSKSVAHRDLKPENVLLSADGNLKLADFGLACLFEHNGVRKKAVSVVGSPPYMAPETVGASKARGYEPDRADVWSCGVVLFVLLVGNTPWDEPTQRSFEYAEYVRLGGRGSPEDELWAKMPPAAVSLLHGMLKLDPDERFSLTEVRTHPWFTRPNRHLGAAGQAADPITLATQMMENLRVDFNADVSSLASASQARLRGHEPMDLDVPQAACDELDMLKVSSTQPDAPAIESPFDWERPDRLFNSCTQPSSYPAGAGGRGLANLSPDLRNILENDIALSQFADTPAVPLSRTQAARRFNDIAPPHSLNQFLSALPLAPLAETVAIALHRLGIAVAPPVVRGDAACLQVATTDGRGQGLKGNVVVERYGADLCECRFVKAKGDPLEWRRLFKRVAVGCRDAIITKQHLENYGAG